MRRSSWCSSRRPAPSRPGPERLACLVRSIRREAPPDGPAWLILADADLAFAADGLAAFTEADAPSVRRGRRAS